MCHNIIKDRLPYLKSTVSLKIEWKASLLLVRYLPLTSELFLPSSGKLWGRDVLARQSQNNWFRDQIHLLKKFLVLQQSFYSQNLCTANNLRANTKATSVSQAGFLNKVLRMSCAQFGQLKNGQASRLANLNAKLDFFSGKTVLFQLDFHHPALPLPQQPLVQR